METWPRCPVVGRRARRGHAGHGGSRQKYLQYTHRRVGGGPLTPRRCPERERGGMMALPHQGLGPGHPGHLSGARARATPWRGR